MALHGMAWHGMLQCHFLSCQLTYIFLYWTYMNTVEIYYQKDIVFLGLQEGQDKQWMVYTMLLYCAIPCSTMPCHAMLCYAMLCSAVTDCAMPCCRMSYYHSLCHAMLSHTVPLNDTTTIKWNQTLLIDTLYYATIVQPSSQCHIGTSNTSLSQRYFKHLHGIITGDTVEESLKIPFEECHNIIKIQYLREWYPHCTNFNNLLTYPQGFPAGNTMMCLLCGDLPGRSGQSHELALQVSAGSHA